MAPDNFQRAFDAVQKAKIRSANCSQKEKDLVQAMSLRRLLLHGFCRCIFIGTKQKIPMNLSIGIFISLKRVFLFRQGNIHFLAILIRIF